MPQVSSTLAISLHADPDKLTNMVVSVYERILARGVLNEALLLVNIDEIVEPRYKHLDKEQLRSLTNKILPSNEALWLFFSYPLLSGRDENFSLLNMHLIGRRYVRGFRATQQGQIQLDLPIADLNTPTSVELMRRHAPTSIRAQDRPNQVSAFDSLQDERTILADHEELFLRACGLLSTKVRAGDVAHAAMFVGNVWRSPVACSAVFHRDAVEFARDFVRIYREYREGIPMPVMLASGVDLWSLEPPEAYPHWGIGVPGKADVVAYTTDYRQKKHNAIIRFLESLSEVTIRKLSSLTGDDVRDLLIQMFVFGTERNIQVHDFGSSGLALTTGPRSRLWLAYKYIADSVT